MHMLKIKYIFSVIATRGKLIFITVLFLSLFVSVDNSFAWVPPAGCSADSYIVMSHLNDSSAPVLTVSFYKNNVYQCEVTIQTLASGYSHQQSGDVGYMSGLSEELIQTMLYVVIGIVLAGTFLGGLYIVNT